MNATDYRAPANGVENVFNRAVRWLTDRGVNLAGAQTLTVTGRVSGTPQRIPVNPLQIDGHEYLVSPRGNTQWSRNARAVPTAELRRGRRVRAVRLAEIAVDQRAPIIRTYLDKWGWEVGRLLPEGLGVDPTDDELARHIADLPVFEIHAA
ncbi:nitroreductase/quinone reductase family protein [Gordonia soli]|nr:nitroreductase/quinone reductase family protein [Gordonia soli]